MFTTKTSASASSGRNWRLGLFRSVATVVALAFMAVSGSEFVKAWILGDPAESIHLWHIAELVALLSILLGGTLFSLLHQPEEKPLLAQFFVLSMGISAIGIMPFEIKAGVLLLIMVLFLATYPRFRILLNSRPQGPISWTLLVASLLLTVMLAPRAYQEIQWQIIGMVEKDIHALDLHWIGSAVLMILLFLSGILSATRIAGWKELSIITGATYCYLGVTAMFLQDGYAGSWSGGYGFIAITAGVFYIIAAFAGAALIRNAQRTRKADALVEGAPEKFPAIHVGNRNPETGSLVMYTLPASRTVQLPETQQLLESYS